MELKKLSLLVALGLTMPAAMAATDTNADVEQLKQRVAQLEGSAEVSSWIERFSVNGFASLAAGFNSDGSGYAKYDDDNINFSEDSLFSVQTTYTINDKMAATLQLASRGSKDWEVESEWAFVSYENDMGTTFRAGKLRMPMFMLSDFLEVGYAYPFARPSVELYDAIPVSSYTGVELLHTFDFGETSLTVQPVYGEIIIGADESSLGIKSTLEDAYGLASTYEWDRLTLRASYFTADAASSVDMLDDKNTDFFGGGVRYDADSWMLMSEYTRIEFDGLYPDTDSYYVALAFPMGSITPYVMYSNFESQDNDEREFYKAFGETSFMDVERSAYSAGVRWDFISNAALKFDVTYADDFGGTSGALSGNRKMADLFDQNGMPGQDGYNESPLNSSKFDDALLYTVKLDIVF